MAEAERGSKTRRQWLTPLLIALAYAAVAVTWLLVVAPLILGKRANEEGEIVNLIVEVAFVVATSVCIHWLITLLRIADQAARERENAEEQRMRDLFAHAPTAIVVSREQTIVYANAALLTLLGYESLASILGKPVISMVAPESHRLIADIEARRAVEDNTPLSYEVTGLRQDGSTFLLAVHSTRMAVPEGQLGIGFLTDISASRAAEQALADSEARYRSLVETASEGIVMLNARAETIFANRRMAEMLGYTPEEMIGLPLHKVLAEEEAARAAANFARRAQGEQGLVEYQYRRKDGSLFWGEVAVSPMYDDAGVFLGVMSLITDVTERHRMQEELRASEERYRRIVETSAEGIWQIDAEGITTFVNTRMADMLGYLPAEMIGRSFRVFMDEEQAEKGLKNLQQRREGIKEIAEYCLRRQDGREIWVAASSTTLLDADQVFSGLLVMISDVTIRHQMEADLRSSEARYRRIVETSVEGIWEIDNAGLTTYVNPRMAEMFGYTPEEMLGRTFLDFMDASERARALANLEKRREGVKEVHDFRFQRKDGSDLWTLVSTNPMKDDTGTFVGALAMVTDISMRHRFEEELRDSEERYRTLFDTVPVPLAVVGLNGHVLLANGAALDAFGYPSGFDITTVDTSSLYDSAEERAAYMADVSANGTVRDRELRFKRRDGRISVALVNADIIVYAGQKALLTSVRDITALKASQEELRTSEERYRTLFDTVPVPLAVVDQASRVLLANHACALAFGYAPDDDPAIVDVISHYESEADREAFHAELSARGVVRDREIKLQGAAGHSWWALVNADIFTYAGQQVMLLSLRDVTALHEAAVALEEHAERLQLVLKAVQAVVATHSVEETASTALAHLRALTGAAGAAVALVNWQAKQGTLVAVDSDAPLSFGAGDTFQVPTAWVETLGHGRSYLREDAPLLENLEPTERVIYDVGMNSWIAYPLLADNRVIGVLGLGCRDDNTCAHLENEEVVQEVAAALAAVLHSAALLQETVAQREQLRELGQRIVASTESERLRIAHELHDTVSQGVAATSILLNLLRRALDPAAPEGFVHRLTNIQAMELETATRLRAVVADLRPPALDDYGLASALEYYVRGYLERTNIVVTVTTDADLPRITDSTELGLFRIAQEALTNIEKHAKATQVEIKITAGPQHTQLQITDNGIGFDVTAKVGEPGHWGLITMKERAAGFNGILTLRSEPGKGTRITVSVKEGTHHEHTRTAG